MFVVKSIILISKEYLKADLLITMYPHKEGFDPINSFKLKNAPIKLKLSNRQIH